MKPFSLVAALEGAELITRNGYRVINFRKRNLEDIEEAETILDVDNANYPYTADVKWTRVFSAEVYTPYGDYFKEEYSRSNKEQCAFDLFLKEESDVYYDFPE